MGIKNKIVSVVLVLACVGGLTIGSASSQTLDDKSELRTDVGHYLENTFRIISTADPLGFEDFESFYLEDIARGDVQRPNTGDQNRTPITGNLTLKSGTSYPFESAYLIRNKLGRYEWLQFQTVTSGHVSFGFRGRFVSKWKINKKYEQFWLNGTLTKYNAGRRVQKRTLPFTVYADM